MAKVPDYSAALGNLRDVPLIDPVAEKDAPATGGGGAGGETHQAVTAAAQAPLVSEMPASPPVESNRPAVDTKLAESTRTPGDKKIRFLAVRVPPEMMRQFRMCVSSAELDGQTVMYDLVSEWIRQHPPK